MARKRIIDPTTGKPFSAAQITGEQPPASPQIRNARRGVNERTPASNQDTARYLVDPDDEFARPFLSVPGGNVFIWPLGTEGFEIVDTAELGKHKYLGDIELDVDVTHRGERSITLSGIFPGWTSVQNMQALSEIFYADTPARGKILHLPGILTTYNYVTCSSLRHSHAEDERTMDIAYSLEVVRIGVGPKAKPTGATEPNQGGKSSVAGTRKFTVTMDENTLREIAADVYGSGARWVDLYAIKKNADFFNNHDVKQHQVPDYRLPNGHIIYY